MRGPNGSSTRKLGPWLASRETIRRKGFGPRGCARVGLLLGLAAGPRAVLPATAPAGDHGDSVPTPNSQPAGITVGPDGALWFTEENGHKIGRITTDGAITEYQIPTVSERGRPRSPPVRTGISGSPSSAPTRPKVGRLTPGPAVCREWDLPAGQRPRRDHHRARRGASGSPRTARAKIGRITARRRLDHGVRPVAPNGYKPGDITTGARRAALVHRIRGAQGRRDQRPTGNPPAIRSTTFPEAIPRASPPPGARSGSRCTGWTRSAGSPRSAVPITEFGPTGSAPSGIALGPDGALWFAETDANKIGRMTTTGRITEFALPSVRSSRSRVRSWPGRTERCGSPSSAATRSAASTPAPRTPSPTAPTRSVADHAEDRDALRRPRRALPGAEGPWPAVRQAPKKLRRAGCRYRIRGKGRVVSSRPRAGTRTRAVVKVRAKRSRR